VGLPFGKGSDTKGAQPVRINTNLLDSFERRLARVEGAEGQAGEFDGVVDG
jgi:hypothetical protein